MTNNRQEKLITLYLYVCQIYQETLQHYCQRKSNNKVTNFSDEEVFTVYLFAGAIEQRYTNKAIHTFAKEYLNEWFPQLPSYQTFCKRLNRMVNALKVFADNILTSFKPADIDLQKSLVDSMPIMLCTGRNRQGKVAREIADKGYCSTKNQYYYGVKFSMLAHRREGTLPFPELYAITPASSYDGKIFQEHFAPQLFDKDVYADKAYQNKTFWKEMEQTHNLKLFSPHKEIKGEPEEERRKHQLERDLHSKAVSSVRQPIESLFNWLNEKANFQRAQKVRSLTGLYVHLFGRLAMAFIYLIFNC